MKSLAILFLFIGLCPSIACAQSVGDVTKLPIPRFVSLKSDVVYARTGPGTRYPIQWVYQQKNLPIEITQEFDGWRKIRDIDGETGWVHSTLLSGKRFALQSAGTTISLVKRPDLNARPVALVEDGALIHILECRESYCHVESGGIEGWLVNESLWGVYEGEQIQ